MNNIFFVAGIVGVILLFFYFYQAPSIPIGLINDDANIGLIDLNDGETTYSGFAGKFLKVNATQDGWEWGDANGGSGSDTNCAISGSCPNIAYKNTDVNFEDVNAQTLTAQVPGGLKFNYGLGSKALEVPFPTACTEVFGVVGFPSTGLEFCASPVVGILMRVLGATNFAFFEGGSNIGGFYQSPQSPPLSPPPSPYRGAVTQWASFADGNRMMCYINNSIGWKECGTYQSQYSPDFRMQTGDFNNTSDKNQLRFLGDVDFNATIDVNGTGQFDGNVETDMNFNLMRVNGKLNGWFLSSIALNGVSCDDSCNQYDVNTGTNFTCVDAFQSAAGTPHVLCSQTTLNKNCLCKN